MYSVNHSPLCYAHRGAATSLRPQRPAPSPQSNDCFLDHFNIILQLRLGLPSNFLPHAIQNTFSLCDYVKVKRCLHYTSARARQHECANCILHVTRISKRCLLNAIYTYTHIL